MPPDPPQPQWPKRASSLRASSLHSSSALPPPTPLAPTPLTPRPQSQQPTMLPAPPSSDPKPRILTHMNADHADSLSRYLQHYLHLPSFTTRSAILTDITAERMTFYCPSLIGGRGYTIPFTPPMRSYADARARLEEMDQAALKALGRSEMTVKTYVPPHGFMLVVFVACCATYFAFSRRGNFLPGAVVYEGLMLGYVPGFARFGYGIQPVLMGLMVSLHAGEAGWMAWGRLGRHSVDVGSGLWWGWVGSTFIEGMGAFVRFDRLVREEEERKRKGRH